jgi:hypothetical protein
MEIERGVVKEARMEAGRGGSACWGRRMCFTMIGWTRTIMQRCEQGCGV